VRAGSAESGLRLDDGMSKITYNGKEYASFDDLPAEAREVLKMSSMFGDANNNGVPDMLEGDATSSKVVISRSTNINTHGDFALDKLPPEMQEFLRRETTWATNAQSHSDVAPPTITKREPTQNSQTLISGPGIDSIYSGAQQPKRGGFVWLLIGVVLGGVAVAVAMNL
jgi:hypothetical protein